MFNFSLMKSPMNWMLVLFALAILSFISTLLFKDKV